MGGRLSNSSSEPLSPAGSTVCFSLLFCLLRLTKAVTFIFYNPQCSALVAAKQKKMSVLLSLLSLYHVSYPISGNQKYFHVRVLVFTFFHLDMLCESDMTKERKFMLICDVSIYLCMRSVNSSSVEHVLFPQALFCTMRSLALNILQGCKKSMHMKEKV